jgi:hypothetical protein
MDTASALTDSAFDRGKIPVEAPVAGSIHRIALVLLYCSIVSVAVAGASATALAADTGSTMQAGPPAEATAGGATGPTTGPTPNTAATNPPSDVAATGEDNIQITQRFALTPDRRGEVAVTVEAAIPSPVVDLTVHLPTEATVVATAGFRRENTTTYEWAGGDRQPELRYRFPVNETRERTGPLADDGRFTFVHVGDWAIVPRPAIGLAWRTRESVGVDRHLAVEGQGVAGTTMALLGPHETHTRAVAGQQFTLAVPRAATLEEPPARILDTLAGAARSLEIGVRDETVLAIVAPTTVPWAARGIQTGETDFWGQADEPVASPENVWIHEYVHTRQDFDATPSASWFREGGATYYAALLTLEQGRIPMEDFITRLSAGERGEQADSVLSRPSTWRPSTAYRKGALAAGVLDRRLRTATDRRRSLADIFRRLNAHGDPVDADTVRSTLADAGGSDPVRAHERFVESSAVPSMWDESAHRAAFGPPPIDIRYEWGDSGRVRVSGPYRNEGLTADPIRLVPGETLTVTARIRNEGTEAGPVEARIEIAGETLARANGTLDSGASTSLTGTFVADETGSYELTVGDRRRGVVVTDPESATVAGVDVQPRSLSVGDQVTVGANLTNQDGSIPARGELTLTVDGEAVARRNVSLAPEASERVEWTIRLDRPGRYRVGVEGAATETVTVDAPTTLTAGTGTIRDAGQTNSDRADGGSSDGPIPSSAAGFGGLPAVAIVIATVLSIRRRRK